MELAVEEELEQWELIHRDLLEDLEELGQEQFLDHQQHHQVLVFMVEEEEGLVTMEQMEVEDREEEHPHLEQHQLILEAEAEEDLLQVVQELVVREE
jgi:hypothetical protein